MRQQLLTILTASLLILPTAGFAQINNNPTVTRLGGQDRSETSLVAAKAGAEANQARYDAAIIVDAGSDKDGATAMILSARMNVPVILVWPRLGLKDKALEPIVRPGGEIIIVGKRFDNVAKAIERDGFTVTKLDASPVNVGKAAEQVPVSGFGWMDKLPIVSKITPRQGEPKVIYAVTDQWQERMIAGNLAARHDGLMVSGANEVTQIHAAYPNVPIKKFGDWDKTGTWPANIPATTLDNKDVRTTALTEGGPIETVYLARIQGKTKKPMFADALVATTVAGKTGVVVLTDPNLVDRQLRNMLKPHTEQDGVTVIGGERAISKQVAEALGWAK